MTDVDVLSDITRKARHHIDHSKVVVCYNSSLASDEAKADAYIAARSLNADHKYAVALGATGARTQATIWQTWASDLADYCIDNNIEAICCTPSFDAAFVIDGLGYSPEDLVSASRFLGHLPNFKSLEEAQGENPLTSTVKYYVDSHFISILQTRPSVGLSNFADSIAGVVLKDNFGVNDVLGLDSGDTLSINSVDSGAFSGIGNSTSNMEPADLTYRGDISSDWTTLPSWRIGWYDLTAGVSECTPALITAMVERAIANEGSIGAHKYRPIVCGSRDRTFGAFSVGAPVWNDILYEELGFNNRKWGWAESGLNAGEFEPATSGSVPEATGYSRYDKNDGENYVGFVLRTSAPADTSASVYRNTRSEYGSPTDYHWEALNDTTFPIPVFALHDQLLTNIISGTDSLQFKPSDPIQVFDIQDGAYAYFSTSTGLRSGNTFIEYGGCAAFGSYFEPLSSQVRSDGAWTKALLQGYSASQAALFAQEQKLLHVPELIGDGLYAPYRTQALAPITLGTTMKKRFRFVATKGLAAGGAMTNSVGNAQLAAAQLGYGPMPYPHARRFLQPNTSSAGVSCYFHLEDPTADAALNVSLQSGGGDLVVTATTSGVNDTQIQENAVDDWITILAAAGSDVTDFYTYQKVQSADTTQYALEIVLLPKFYNNQNVLNANTGVYRNALTIASITSAEWDFASTGHASGILTTAGVTRDDFADNNNKTIFQPNLIDVTDGDENAFGQAFDSDTFVIYMIPLAVAADGHTVSTDSAQITALVGEQIKIASLEIYDEITNESWILNREDFSVGLSGGTYLYYTLNSLNGVAERKLGLQEGVGYACTVTFEATDLAFSGGSPNIISNDIIS